MEKKQEEKCAAEVSLYSDTWKLLKQYRDIAWELELAAKEVRNQFGLESGGSIEELLPFLASTEKDLPDRRIERDIRIIESSHQVLKLMDDSMDLLRTRHKNGESLYWLLYYTFFLPQKLRNTEEVIEKLCPHIRDISSRTYYRKRKMAIEVLSPILWSCSKSSRELLKQFVP